MTTTDTLQHLVETLANGQRGFAEGAEKLTKDGQPQIAATFTQLSQERAQFAQEIRTLDSSVTSVDAAKGTLPGALHRGWLAVKDLMNGDSPQGVLDAAAQGEDHAVEAFTDALKADLPEATRSVVARQRDQIQAARETVQRLRAQN